MVTAVHPKNVKTIWRVACTLDLQHGQIKSKLTNKHNFPQMHSIGIEAEKGMIYFTLAGYGEYYANGGSGEKLVVMSVTRVRNQGTEVWADCSPVCVSSNPEY